MHPPATASCEGDVSLVSLLASAGELRNARPKRWTWFVVVALAAATLCFVVLGADLRMRMGSSRPPAWAAAAPQPKQQPPAPPPGPATSALREAHGKPLLHAYTINLFDLQHAPEVRTAARMDLNAQRKAEHGREMRATSSCCSSAAPLIASSLLISVGLVLNMWLA